MAHTLAAHLRTRYLNPQRSHILPFIADFLILAAMTFQSLVGPKIFRRKAVPFRFRVR
jgi:hypothetical protein